MRKIIFYCTVWISFTLSSQETPLSSKVLKLKEKISISKEGEKLKLLVELCELTKNQSKFKYDSIVKETIVLAEKLDSTSIALKHTSDRIFYLTNRIRRPKEGLKIFKEVAKKKNENVAPLLLAVLYTNGADSHYFSGEIKESIAVYTLAENYALKAGDSIQFAMAKMYKSGAYSDYGDLIKSSKLLKESIDIFKRKKDTNNIINAKTSLTILYSRIGFYKEAKIERDEVIAITSVTHQHGKLIPSLYNASLDANKLEKQAERISYLKEAYKHSFEPGEESTIGPLMMYGLLSAYADNDSLQKAEFFYKKIEKEYGTKTFIPFEEAYRNAMVDYFYYKKNYRKALSEAKWVLASRNKSGNKEGILFIKKKLSNIYVQLNNKEKALVYYKEYKALKDSLNSLKNTKALSFYQALYKTEKREAKILNQQTKIKVLNNKNSLKNRWMIFGGVGIASLCTIVYLLILRGYVRKKRKLQVVYSRNFITAQEKERTRLANNLYRSIGQKLVTLYKTTADYKDDGIKDLTLSTLEELKNISKGLYPVRIDETGVTRAIKMMIDEVNMDTETDFSYNINDIDDLLTKEDALHLFRIIQESVNNIVKHSKATKANISVKVDKAVIYTVIKDNGTGFEFLEKLKNNKSLGIRTLMERSRIIESKFRVYSEYSKGTIIEITIPV